jgi:hypothetical protein
MRTKSTLEKAVKFVTNCKFIFSFKKNIFQKNIFSILFCFVTTLSFAQAKNVDSYLTNLEKSGAESDALHVKHLLYDLQSAVYYYSDYGTPKTYGDNPTALFTDINSISTLGSSSLQNDDIEIATIKIAANSDLNKTIDLASFSGFEKLKYIYIFSEIPANETAINNLLKNDSSKYVVIYTVSIGG